MATCRHKVSASSTNSHADLLLSPSRRDGFQSIGSCMCVLLVRGCFSVCFTGTILSVCWLPAAGSRLQPQLLLGLANATVLALTAPARPPQHGSSLDLEPAAVHAVTWSAPTALQALTLLQHDSSSSSSATQARVSGTADSSAQVLAAGCDGKLYWLQLPPPAAATAAASAPHGKSSSTQAVSILSKVPLPWPAVALAVSPSGHEVLAAAADGAALLLPTSASAAVSMVGAAGLESSAGQGVGAAGGAAVPSTVLAWSPDSSWAATAGADGSLLVYATGAVTAASSCRRLVLVVQPGCSRSKFGEHNPELASDRLFISSPFFCCCRFRQSSAWSP